MIDGTSTTVEWEQHKGTICVWGIGAFEQHSAHLPLSTDILGADYWARFVAEELDAALLPTMPFGTSLEMTAFRGTMTLHPETLMQVVRDIADEVERQGFRILIVINGHGGNHCLVPVIRDINRVNRPLKIIMVPPGQCCDPALKDDNTTRPSFHSGESETSRMLATHPELVRKERIDIEYPEDGSWTGLVQTDLTTFGIGHISPGGAAGEPSKATREKGEKIIASVKKNLIPFLKERIRRLEENPTY